MLSLRLQTFYAFYSSQSLDKMVFHPLIFSSFFGVDLLHMIYCVACLYLKNVVFGNNIFDTCRFFEFGKLL